MQLWALPLDLLLGKDMREVCTNPALNVRAMGLMLWGIPLAWQGQQQRLSVPI